MSENIKDNINVVNEENSSASNEVKRIDLYKLVETYNKRSSIKMKEEFLKYLDYQKNNITLQQDYGPGNGSNGGSLLLISI